MSFVFDELSFLVIDKTKLVIDFKEVQKIVSISD
jgi:hypothetical protein